MNMLLWVTICTISSRRKEKGKKGGHALLCKWYMFCAPWIKGDVIWGQLAL
jgi:hypothetical protein